MFLISKVKMDLSPRSDEDVEIKEVDVDVEIKEVDVDENPTAYAEKDVVIEAKTSSLECDLSASAPAESDHVPVIHIPSDSANSDQEPSIGAKKRKPQKTTKLQVRLCCGE